VKKVNLLYRYSAVILFYEYMYAIRLLKTGIPMGREDAQQEERGEGQGESRSSESLNW